MSAVATRSLLHLTCRVGTIILVIRLENINGTPRKCPKITSLSVLLSIVFTWSDLAIPQNDGRRCSVTLTCPLSCRNNKIGEKVGKYKRDTSKMSQNFRFIGSTVNSFLVIGLEGISQRRRSSPGYFEMPLVVLEQFWRPSDGKI